MKATPPRSAGEMQSALRAAEYIADPGLAIALTLGLQMRRPLLVEGEPGVGKTELARALAQVLGADLIRLQCYEGIDASQALYDWNYARQMLYVRRLEDGDGLPEDLYGEDFLIERPLLRALRGRGPRVLLIDELDRADDEFDAFLLEVLADYAVTIPEIGRIEAESPPVVVITSNRTRDLHHAIKRRCLYHWLDYPALRREAEIIRMRVPGVDEGLANSVARAVAELRAMDLAKPPGASEAIDWAHALALMGMDRVMGDAAAATLGWVIKNPEDQQRVRPWLEAHST